METEEDKTSDAITTAVCLICIVRLARGGLTSLNLYSNMYNLKDFQVERKNDRIRLKYLSFRINVHL